MKKSFINLTSEQIQKKVNYINDYKKAVNASTGSDFDSNANFSSKNIRTLENELFKDANIQINRKIISNKLKELFGVETAKDYIKMLDEHIIYTHDETSLAPYCVSVSLYPFLLNGLKDLNKTCGSTAPKHLASFCGGFVNLLYCISSQFAGAVATVEFLMYFDYFARKDYGDNYLKTNLSDVHQGFSNTVYSINQPNAVRGYQSVFWNISIFDSYYFNAMFEDFVFPDGSKPNYDTLKELQKEFMRWFNEERTKTLLTFPVVTSACLNDGYKLKDADFFGFISEELSKGDSFFIYTSKNASALSSCCRLRNSVEDQLKEFSYTLGAGGIMTGSLNVITMNLNIIAQKGLKLQNVIQKVHKFQVAFRYIFQDFLDAGLLPVYSANFIDMKKQFLTIGINGFAECAEFFGLKVSNNEKYIEFIKKTLNIITEENKRAKKKYNLKFNTEMVPAENLGVKQAHWEAKTKVALYKYKNEKYPENTLCLLKNREYKKIQDIKWYNRIKEVIKYSSFLGLEESKQLNEAINNPKSKLLNQKSEGKDYEEQGMILLSCGGLGLLALIILIATIIVIKFTALY